MKANFAFAVACVGIGFMIGALSVVVFPPRDNLLAREGVICYVEE